MCSSSTEVVFNLARPRQRDEEEWITVARVVYEGTADVTLLTRYLAVTCVRSEMRSGGVCVDGVSANGEGQKVKRIWGRGG